jgi:WD40 repeat protein
VTKVFIRLVFNKAKSLLFIGTSSGSLHIIDIINRKELKHFIQHKSAIFEIVENHVKKHIYSTDADGNLAVWNSENFELLLFLPFLCGKIRNIHVNPKGEVIYLACQDGKIRLIETENFNELTSFFAHENGVNFINSFDSKLFSVGKDGYLKIWDIDNFSLLKSIPAHNFGIYQLKFFNNHHYFATVSRDKSIKIWDTEKLTVLKKIERKDGGHSHAINAISKISEHEFTTVGDDKRVNVWELIN